MPTRTVGFRNDVDHLSVTYKSLVRVSRHDGNAEQDQLDRQLPAAECDRRRISDAVPEIRQRDRE